MVRSNRMSWVPTPSLKECLGELLCEEHCCITQATLDQKGVTSLSLSLSLSNDVAYAAQTKGHNMTTTQWYSCKEYGHIATRHPVQEEILLLLQKVRTCHLRVSQVTVESCH